MSTNERPTPETQAAVFYGRDMGEDKGPPHFECVDADFASRLEQQRDEARRELDERNDVLIQINHTALKANPNCSGIPLDDCMRKLLSQRDELLEALIPFAQIGDIANDADCTLWKRLVSAGSVRKARSAIAAVKGNQ